MWLALAKKAKLGGDFWAKAWKTKIQLATLFFSLAYQMVIFEVVAILTAWDLFIYLATLSGKQDVMNSYPLQSTES